MAVRLPRSAELDAHWSEPLAHALEVQARELTKTLAELANAGEILDDQEAVASQIRQTAALIRSARSDLESHARALRAQGRDV